MRIHFEQTGGIMGRKVVLDLASADLPTEDLASLRQILEEANFFDLPENAPLSRVPDERQYLITVETENVTHSVQTSDTAAPPPLEALIQFLVQQSRVNRDK